MESWANVVGYEGIYEVSDNGNVRNAVTKKTLSPGKSQGYFYVALYKNKSRKNKQVHRLVAEAFIQNPEGLPIINHKDEVRTNNRVENLEWCTYKYNNMYNGASEKRAEKLRGRTAWNKGKQMPKQFRESVSEGMKEWHREKKRNSD